MKRASRIKRLEKIERRILWVLAGTCREFHEIEAAFKKKPTVTQDEIRAALAWLKGKGWIEAEDGHWYLTHAGVHAYADARLRARSCAAPSVRSQRE